jgi:uncharacterized membrane-anchored protein YjiN (DUF445 family)
MAEIRIPKSQEVNFEILFSWEKTRLTKLLELLKTAEAGLSPEKVSEKYHEAIDVSQTDLEKVMSVIYNITRIKSVSEHSSEKIADDFVYALSKTGNEKFAKDKIKDYLLEILKPNNFIFLTITTANVVGERDKILKNADILTDVRPIFEKEQIKGFTVIHTLKLEVFDNAQNDDVEIYLAMDKSDMEKLEKLIQQAKAREASTKSSISGQFVELS